jgi:MscS family membrane protein
MVPRSLSTVLIFGLLFAALCAVDTAVAQPQVKKLAESDSDAAKQPTEMPPKPPPPAGPADDFDRGVPRSSVMGFLAAASDDDWERAGEYLDVRSLPRASRCAGARAAAEHRP